MKARSWVGSIAAIYLAALALPAVGDWEHGLWLPGYLCLIGVPAVCRFPAWWANVLFFPGLVCLAKERYAIAGSLGVVATLLGLRIFPEILEGEVLPGSIAWIAALGALAAGGFAMKIRSAG